jgi:catechol 2,3-dioxygenase-like lactoylglutathione lyase family enzyme
MSVVGLVTLKVCCSDLERSRRFYQVLGYTAASPPGAGTDWVAELYGVPGTALRVQMLTRPDEPRAAAVELLEWAPSVGQPPVANTIGAGMAGFRSNDLDADCAALEAAGGRRVSDPVSTPGPAHTTRFVHVRDPDGFNIQLIQFVKVVPST